MEQVYMFILLLINTLQLPVNRGLALRGQQVVRLRKMPAAEEGSACQRRRMRRLKHMMTRTVYEVPLAAGKISPEHEHHAVGIVRYAADHSVSELFPADPAVGCRLTAAHGQYCIQQQHTLTGPFLEIRISAHPDAEIRLYLLEYVLQGRRCRHTFRHGER